MKMRTAIFILGAWCGILLVFLICLLGSMIQMPHKSSAPNSDMIQRSNAASSATSEATDVTIEFRAYGLFSDPTTRDATTRVVVKNGTDVIVSTSLPENPTVRQSASVLCMTAFGFGLSQLAIDPSKIRVFVRAMNGNWLETKIGVNAAHFVV
jgi:hypothetical protein